MPSRLKLATMVLIPMVGLALSALAIWIAELKGVSFDPGIQLLLVVSGGILTAVLELVVVLAERTYHRDKERVQQTIVHRGEVEIENIRATFPRIVESSYSADSDLYVEYFIRRFGEMAREVGTAADAGVLRVTHAHAMSIDNVLEPIPEPL